MATQPWRSSWVMANGIRTHYTEAGDDGPVVILLHGGGPGSSTELLTIFAYKLNFKFWNLGYGSAAVAILFLISFIISFFFVKLTYKEVNT